MKVLVSGTRRFRKDYIIPVLIPLLVASCLPLAKAYIGVVGAINKDEEGNYIMKAPVRTGKIELRKTEMPAFIFIEGWYQTDALINLSAEISKNRGNRGKLLEIARTIMQNYRDTSGGTAFWRRYGKVDDRLRWEGADPADGKTETKKWEHCYTGKDLDDASILALKWAKSNIGE